MRFPKGVTEETTRAICGRVSGRIPKETPGDFQKEVLKDSQEEFLEASQKELPSKKSLKILKDDFGGNPVKTFGGIQE